MLGLAITSRSTACRSSRGENLVNTLASADSVGDRLFVQSRFASPSRDRLRFPVEGQESVAEVGETLERDFWREIPIQPPVDRFVGNPEAVRPLLDCQRLSVKCYAAAAAGIQRLLGLGCPPHIAWFVAFFVIDPLNRMFCGGFWSYMSKELFERVPPLLKYANPAFSIVLIVGISWIMAAPNHVRPTAVFRGIRHPVSLWMILFRQAPTRVLLSVTEAIEPYGRLLHATITHALRECSERTHAY